MKVSLPIMALGILLVVFGILFHLQGQAVVGPESSFMYSNPDWITYGIGIFIAGSSILVIGIIIKIFLKS